MAIIGLLTYPDFERELEITDQFRPIRVQHYSRAKRAHEILNVENITYYIQLGYHTEEDDILLCRWRIGHLQAAMFRNPLNDAWSYDAKDQERNKALTARTKRAAALLRDHLVAQNYYVLPGLIQLSEPVRIDTEWPAFWLDGALDGSAEGKGGPDAD